jgi:hypothetical protein
MLDSGHNVVLFHDARCSTLRADVSDEELLRHLYTILKHHFNYPAPPPSDKSFKTVCVGLLQSSRLNPWLNKPLMEKYQNLLRHQPLPETHDPVYQTFLFTKDLKNLINGQKTACVTDANQGTIQPVLSALLDPNVTYQTIYNAQVEERGMLFESFETAQAIYDHYKTYYAHCKVVIVQHVDEHIIQQLNNLLRAQPLTCTWHVQQVTPDYVSPMVTHAPDALHTPLTTRVPDALLPPPVMPIKKSCDRLKHDSVIIPVSVSNLTPTSLANVNHSKAKSSECNFLKKLSMLSYQALHTMYIYKIEEQTYRIPIAILWACFTPASFLIFLGILCFHAIHTDCATISTVKKNIKS